MKKIYLFLLFWAISDLANGQNDYFFAKKMLNPAIPTPEQFFGYPIGSHHTRWDKIVEYMTELDRVSNRVIVKKIGKTNEHRDQIIVHFSNPSNLANLEQIRKEHLDIANSIKTNTSQTPLIVWLGYNVHGNEPSGGEASILTAYYLAATENAEALKWLENSIILMEPVINPDGRDRHTQWVNSHKGNPLVADANDREHNEVWPGGRTNHYWFDLNRDWYLAVNVESRNRLAYYHQWLPNVVTDFHEMGTNSTHFFEPTKENAENPLVPKYVYKNLNSAFSKYFEAAMNEIGSFYYTKESFDNLYPGYGSSYPDMQGGLGLLFEQASSRGHLQESQNGNLKFGFTVKNQLVNALATIRAAHAEKENLIKHQRSFFKSSIDQGKNAAVKAYVIGDEYDQSRNRAFWDLLLQHKIEFFHLNNDLTENGQKFTKGKAVVIPAEQAQYLIVRSIFDRPTSFADSIFYDTSAWNLALAYNLPHAELKGIFSKGAKITDLDLVPILTQVKLSQYAYLLDWSDYYAPKALFQMQEKGILTKISLKPFVLDGKKWPAGTVLIPVVNQEMSGEKLHTELQNISKKAWAEIKDVGTGMATDGVDLGSNSFQTVRKPKALIVAGNGVTTAEVGEIWHLLDTKIGMPITKVEIGNFGRVNLHQYTSMVIVGGNYSSFDKGIVEKIRLWINAGGTLITLKTGTEWVIKSGLSKEKLREMKPDTSRIQSRIAFENYQNSLGAKQTGGAIFEAELDLTHPIAFGFYNKKIPIYRNNNTIMERSSNPASSVLVYTVNPRISGYVHAETLKKISGSAAVNISTEGSGRIIMFSDNPNFRGTWFGTNKLFLNALFFGSQVGFQSQFGEEE